MYFFCDGLARKQVEKNVPYMFYERIIILAFLSNFFISFLMFNEGLIELVQGEVLIFSALTLFILPMLIFNSMVSYYRKNLISFKNGLI